MDRGAALLNDLRNKLQGGWYGPIQRASGGKLEFLALPNGAPGEFLVRVTWETPVSVRTFEKAFTRQLAFGSSYTLSPMAWRVERRACDHARAVIREVLQHRGVL